MVLVARLQGWLIQWELYETASLRCLIRPILTPQMFLGGRSCGSTIAADSSWQCCRAFSQLSTSHFAVPDSAHEDQLRSRSLVKCEYP
ncbi:hypothetical protein KL925_004941 [Ogataea polymorpha]|nr:hypothetical protein KL925_004941 [Ogataea polymorpha]